MHIKQKQRSCLSKYNFAMLNIAEGEKYETEKISFSNWCISPYD